MQTIEGNGPSVRNRRLVVTLVAAVATLFVVMSPAAALAHGGRHHHRADVTFTKWVTSPPVDPTTSAGAGMVGVVGGDVGPGRFVGAILGADITSQPHHWLGHARYEFYGRRHSFIADIQVNEDDTSAVITATITGVVTSGWLRGAQVTGGYTQFDACPIPTPGNLLGATCWVGTLHLERGHRHHGSR